MYVRHLTVADFRSWSNADIGFDPGISVLVGSNGQGKTNLIEAIGYLSTLASHRVSNDQALVRFGAERAVAVAAVVSDGRELRLEIEITPGRANKAKVNSSAMTRTRELAGLLRTVLFAPEDLAVVRGDPSERRRFIDDLLVQRTPRLAGVRGDYERVLKQRAALLKSAGAARRAGRTGDLSTLDVWDGHLAHCGSQLIAARLELLDSLQPQVTLAYAHVARTSEPLSLSYLHSVTTVEPAERDAGVIEAALAAELARVRSQELERGVNLAGPHRDDVELRIGALPVRGYASHGESWSSALALRLGSYELLRDDGAEPVLILDDVFAELDADRREQLAIVADKAEQTIITAAVASDVPAQLQGSRYDVHEGQVRRVI